MAEDLNDNTPTANYWREQVSYWREHFALRPPTLQLPNDRPRPAVPDWRCGVETLSLDSDQWERVSKLATRLTGATAPNPLIADPILGASAVIITATWIVLSRWAGEEDLAAACFAFRPLPHTIGPLARPLPLRCHVHSKLSFLSLFHDLLTTLGQCARYQDVSAEAIAAEIGDDVAPISFFLPGSLPTEMEGELSHLALLSPYDLSFQLRATANAQGTNPKLNHNATPERVF